MTTNQQMRYYRSSAVLGKIATHKGMHADQAHEWMKQNIFKKSTTQFSEIEFEEKLTEIRSEFSKEGLWIAEPNEEEIPPQDTTDYSDIS